MEHWVLIIQLSGGAIVPIQDFFSEKECLATLHEYKFFEEGTRGGCALLKEGTKKRKK